MLAADIQKVQTLLSAMKEAGATPAQIVDLLNHTIANGGVVFKFGQFGNPTAQCLLNALKEAKKAAK